MEDNIHLTACYTVFNGCELLAGSIKQIYNHVDSIVLCVQSQSNTGNIIDYDDAQIVWSIGKIFKKVHVITFKPDLNLSTKENERRKHQLMIDKAKELNSTHFLMSAADHYYKTEEFAKAKRIAIDGNYDLTASLMFTYYKEPTFQLDPIEDYYMPFIMKLKDSTIITRKNYDFKVDPSVRIEPVNSQRIFRQEELMMHHFSMIRKDIRSKFSNSASAGNWTEKIPAFIEEYENAKVGDEISYFKNRKLIAVSNFFQIK
jgi:hypothetical protein